MKIAYTILELDRKENSKKLRTELSFLNELKTLICDGRIEYPECISKYPQFDFIFSSLTNPGFIGLWISTLNTFYSFLSSDYDYILILEDDAVLIDNFESNFKESLDELPSEFGLFSIGYRDVYKTHYSVEHYIEAKKKTCRLFQGGDSWGILYSRAFVEEFLNFLQKYKSLKGLSDSAIFSYALRNTIPTTKLKSYSLKPSFGSLIKSNTFISSIGTN